MKLLRLRRVFQYADFWNCTIVNEEEIPYKDITSSFDELRGIRRLAIQNGSSISGMIIREEDRAVIYYSIDSMTFDFGE